MSANAANAPQNHPWTITESESPITTVETSGPFKGLPDRLKGYRPGRGVPKPPAPENPSPDTPPSEGQPE